MLYTSEVPGKGFVELKNVLELLFILCLFIALVLQSYNHSLLAHKKYEKSQNPAE